MPAQKIVNFCVIGAGRAGTVHARNIMTRVKNAELVAIVDSDLAAATKLGEELGGLAVFKDLTTALRKSEFDAVVITTPTFTHTSLTIEAAEAGKHVFCEKPMALTLEEADKMISVTKRYGVKLQIGFMRRFDPEFTSAKKIVESGEIGRPILVKSVGRGPGLPPPWALDPKTGIGFLAEVNSHDFDTLRWIMGDEYSSICCDVSALIRPDLREKYPNFYDVAVVLARFRNNGLGVIDGACPVGYGYDARIEILGTEGVITVGEIRGTTLTRVTKDMRVLTESFKSWRDRFRDGYINEIEHFADCIIHDKEPSVTGVDGRKALEAVLAAHKSVETGRPVALPLA
jgi:myo-inositol 2-dehydrogenase/D-chiro-inositol 1-dehydrogenase/scyllo-inositol 2-dehydrogenase (NAD+)